MFFFARSKLILSILFNLLMLYSICQTRTVQLCISFQVCWSFSLYRQRLIYQRVGVDLARLTLLEWVSHCGVELQPLAEALNQIILQQQVIRADETSVAVMQIARKKPKKGYVWTYATAQYNLLQAVIYLSAWAATKAAQDRSTCRRFPERLARSTDLWWL